jgi:hypothetical protein
MVLHPMEDHKKMPSIRILIKIEVEVVKPHFEVDMEAHMVDIINMKVSFIKVEETLKEEEVVEVVVEVIKSVTKYQFKLLLL